MRCRITPTKMATENQNTTASGREEIVTPTHCRWDCQMAQPPQGNSLVVPQKLNRISL